MRRNSDVSPVNAPSRPSPSAPADVRRAKRLSEAPLSFAQERLWFLHQLDPGSHYNDHFHLRLPGSLDTGALEQSLREIVMRHDALRTTFAVRDGRPVQLVHPPGPWRLAETDLEGVPEPRRLAEALRLAVEKGSAPFDLTIGPLWRFELLRLKPDDHFLLVTAHHIAIDGWSRGIFLRELSAIYDAIVSGRPSPLAELPLQMADFAASERAATSGPADPSIEYWKKELRDLPPALGLPADRPRPSSPSHRGARQPLAFDRRLTSRLKEFGRSERATLFMTLLAGFAAVLHRYTGKTDLIVGFPVANRSRIEVEGLIGFFVNMLPLRARVGADDTFRSLVRSVRRSALDAYEHQDFSFEELVRLVQPVRTRSHHPLFQVLFVFQNAPMSVSSARGLAIRPVEVDPGTAKFDLTVNLAEVDGRLEGWIEYATDLFDADRVERMAGHLGRLLDGAAAEPDVRISRLPLLREEELRELLVERNATSAAYPRDRCIQEVFESVVDEAPGAVAVVGANERLTYRELDQRANRLGRYLKRRGVGPEVRVGVCLERSVDAVVSFLAILKAGGAYVPLDPAQPKARLAVLLEDASPVLVLTTSRLAARLPEHAAKRVELDSEQRAIRAESLERPQAETNAESLASIMYTSGSSGAPKGVAVVHRGIVRLVRSADYASLSSDRVFLQLAPLAFDASTFEIWGALLNGARLVLAPQAPSLAELEQILREHGVTTLWLSAGLFHAIVDERPEALGTVRELLTGGDVVSARHAARFLEKCPGTRLINGYGPTEATTFTCCHTVTADAGQAQAVPIGRPIANTRVYLLDGNRQPVPVGVPGELYVGGDGLARGYWNQPELTRERFVELQLPGPPPEKLYRTGDLACHRADGTVGFLGRLDEQVKIRGYRVELAEVESALGRHACVRESAVIVRRGDPGGPRLVAYVVPDPEAVPSPESLRAYLGRLLPDYMIPSAFVLADAIPLTPNGKADKRVLAALPEDGGGSGRASAVAPRDDVERRLARLWEEVLEIGPIGVRDNFFDVGGHSLAAVRLFAKIEEEFGRVLAVSRLVETPTVEGLARALRETASERPPSSLVAIRPGGSRPPLFLVHSGRGHVLIYTELASLLDRDQPVYGLEALVAEDGRPRHTTIPEMATHFVSEISSVQSSGPYFLGGSSLGGNIAFEMARQLERVGQKVALLALFDSNVPSDSSTPRPKPTGPRTLSERAVFHARKILTLPPREKLGYAQERGRSLARRIFSRLSGLPRKPPKVITPFMEAGKLAWRRHEPGAYGGRVTLFRAEVPDPYCNPEPELGWGGRCAGGVEIVDIPGGHVTMFTQPYVRDLAERLDECLERAGEQKPGTRVTDTPVMAKAEP